MNALFSDHLAAEQGHAEQWRIQMEHLSKRSPAMAIDGGDAMSRAVHTASQITATDDCTLRDAAPMHEASCTPANACVLTDGRPVKPSAMDLGGSFTQPANAKAGDTFHADLGASGAITLQFF
jgi:hypothetical protein